MENEHLRVGAIPDICPGCGAEINGKVKNVDIIRTQNGEPYRMRCGSCFVETFEQACPECGGRDFHTDGDALYCSCGKLLNPT